MTISAIAFDWGNTLMRVLPEYSGVMADWPRVEAVPGAEPALSALAQRARLVVATNAADSNAEQVMRALARVGLDAHLERVYTMHELGARKPAAAFFGTLAQQLGLPAHQLMMVGDEYLADIVGAQRLGWRTVWLNPSGLTAPGLLPLQDAEITSLAELPALLDDLSLPGYADCLAWLTELNNPAILLAHVQGVAALSYGMAVWLRAAGLTVNPLLAHRGGLLHDLSKLSADGHQHHGEAAAVWLEAHQQPILAEIARRHMLFGLLNPPEAPQTWEEKIVYYADKLVEGSKLVGVPARLKALQQRYGTITPAKLAQLMPALNTLEAELCAPLGLTPEGLLERLQQAYGHYLPTARTN